MFNWLVSFRNLNARNAAATRRQEWRRCKRKVRSRSRPQLEKLQDRIVPTCTNGTTEPWCLDDGFGPSGDGHGAYDIGNSLEEIRATLLQLVGGDDRYLLGGYARDLSTGNFKFALMRVCPNGLIDNGDDINNCSGTGFGQHVGGNDARGVIVTDFAAPVSGNPDIETITALDLQQVTATSACGGATQRIIAAGNVPVAQGIVGRTFGVARYCPDGEVDTSWGGMQPDWAVSGGLSYVDPAGMVTIGFNDSSDQPTCATPGWAKKADLSAMMVEPDTNKIVVAGTIWLPPPPQPNEQTYHAIARLNADGTFDAFGPTGTTDCDHGRLYFDGGGGTTPNAYVDNEIRGIQLVQVSANVHDILIAGQTRLVVTPTATLDFFVARVASNGLSIPWMRRINWQDGSTSRDDIAMDLVFNSADSKVVVAGITCTTASCIANDTSPSSDLVFARLDASNGTSDYTEKRVTTDHSLNGTHTDVANSVVLQPQTAGDPKIVIGGYSVGSDGGTPYMSGRRFVYTDPNPATFDFFRSNFSGGSTGVGDQIAELRVQTDNRKIVAGGFHTGSGNKVFGELRTCPDTDESNCTGTAPGGNFGGGGGNDFKPPSAGDISIMNSFTSERETYTPNLPAQRTSQQSPAPPMPEVPAGDAMSRQWGASRVLVAKPEADALFRVTDALEPTVV